METATHDHWFIDNQIDVIHVGAKYKNSWDLVVEAPQCLPGSTTRYAIRDVGPTEPAEVDVMAHGKRYAKTKAQNRFIHNALDAFS